MHAQVFKVFHIEINGDKSYMERMSSRVGQISYQDKRSKVISTIEKTCQQHQQSISILHLSNTCTKALTLTMLNIHKGKMQSRMRRM